MLTRRCECAGEVLTESEDIVAFADKEGGGPPLIGNQGGEQLWDVAKQVRVCRHVSMCIGVSGCVQKGPSVCRLVWV